jgi:hypothetical protein
LIRVPPSYSGIAKDDRIGDFHLGGAAGLELDAADAILFCQRTRSLARAHRPQQRLAPSLVEEMMSTHPSLTASTTRWFGPSWFLLKRRLAEHICLAPSPGLPRSHQIQQQRREDHEQRCLPVSEPTPFQVSPASLSVC